MVTSSKLEDITSHRTRGILVNMRLGRGADNAGDQVIKVTEWLMWNVEIRRRRSFYLSLSVQRNLRGKWSEKMSEKAVKRNCFLSGHLI